jgi:hypothetical protein
MTTPYRTATINSGITATLQTLDSLLNGVTSLAGRTKSYDDVIIENTGSVSLYFAVIDLNAVPTSADQRTLAPGVQKTFEQISTSQIYIATSDIGGTNVLEFEGRPVYRQ